MKEEKKVLHIVDSLNKGSGVTSVVMNFFQKKSVNYQYDFLVLFNNRPVNFENKVKQRGANIYKVQDEFNFSFLKFFKNTKKIAKEHSNKYDVIHIHTIQFSLFILLFFKKYNPTLKFVVHSHNARIGNSFLKSIRNFLLVFPARFLFKNKIACSVAAFKGTFGNSKKMIIIQNAIDSSRFCNYDVYREEFRNKYKIEKHTQVIGHIGRFDLQKNHQFLLNIFEAVLSKNKKYILCLVGEGDLKLGIIKKAKKIGIFNQIIFLPPTSKVEKYYAMFDLFLFPSLFEGLPLTLQEAQASGLKCIVSDTISSEGQLHPLCTAFSLEENVNVWVDEILATNTADRARFSEIYKEKGLSLEKEMLKLESLYSTI